MLFELLRGHWRLPTLPADLSSATNTSTTKAEVTIKLAMCDIWEEFRAALCISGGNRRTTPSLPPPDLTGGGEEGGGGEEEEEDRLSALPDDVLLFILSRLPSTAAARTSVLSRRWRRLWTQLPVLWFPLPAEPAVPLPSPATSARARVRSHRWRRLLTHLRALRSPLPAQPARARSSLASARAALAQHSAPSLWTLSIAANDADPADAAAVLRLAAPRLTSALFFGNVVPEDRKKAVVHEGLVIELPCFNRAVHLSLCLGYLRLAFPPSGVFTKLTVLVLSQVRFQGTLDIGDTFSSARCPSLRLLCLFNAQGVSNLSICSESLVSMFLCNLKELQQLTVVSPMLRDLSIWNCFFKRQPVADIAAPVLERFAWIDEYDPRWVQLGKLAQLRVLATSFFAGGWYGLTGHQYNLGIVKLLQRFKKIPDLHITIFYPAKMTSSQNWMETLTLLWVQKLHLVLLTSGHAIGSCVFHFLKISTSIRRLFLDIRGAIKDGSACSPDCLCHEDQDWEIEELALNSLQELHICGFSGSDYDSTFVERLLGWTGALESVTISFDPKATVDEELCEELRGLSGPETCMKIYLYRNGAKVMYTHTPVD